MGPGQFGWDIACGNGVDRHATQGERGHRPQPLEGHADRLGIRAIAGLTDGRLPAACEALVDALAERLREVLVEKRRKEQLMGVADRGVTSGYVPPRPRWKRILDATLEPFDGRQLLGREESRRRGDTRERRRLRQRKAV